MFRAGWIAIFLGSCVGASQTDATVWELGVYPTPHLEYRPQRELLVSLESEGWTTSCSVARLFARRTGDAKAARVVRAIGYVGCLDDGVRMGSAKAAPAVNDFLAKSPVSTRSRTPYSERGAWSSIDRRLRFQVVFDADPICVEVTGERSQADWEVIALARACALGGLAREGVIDWQSGLFSGANEGLRMNLGDVDEAADRVDDVDDDAGWEAYNEYLVDQAGRLGIGDCRVVHRQGRCRPHIGRVRPTKAESP